MKSRLNALGCFVSLAMALLWGISPTQAQQSQKPNIIMIVSDDFGYGDSSPYGGGPGRGMPTSGE